MDTETHFSDYLLPMVVIVAVVVLMLLFAGYAIHEHELTIRHCVTQGMHWTNGSCVDSVQAQK